jgi:hypothetical protein
MATPDQCTEHCDTHREREMNLQRQITTMRQQISAQAELFRNPSLSAATKLVAIAVINEAGWRESVGESTPYTVNCQRLADCVGLGRQTIGRHLDVLASADGLFEKRVTRQVAEDGSWRSAIQLTPQHGSGAPAMLRAAAIYAPERPPWGGARRTICPEHPNAAVVERQTLVCAECGQVLASPVRIL